MGNVKVDPARNFWSLCCSLGGLREEDKDQGQNRQQGDQRSLKGSHCECIEDLSCCGRTAVFKRVILFETLWARLTHWGRAGRGVWYVLK